MYPVHEMIVFFRVSFHIFHGNPIENCIEWHQVIQHWEHILSHLIIKSAWSFSIVSVISKSNPLYSRLQLVPHHRESMRWDCCHECRQRAEHPAGDVCLVVCILIYCLKISFIPFFPYAGSQPVLSWHSICFSANHVRVQHSVVTMFPDIYLCMLVYEWIVAPNKYCFA